MLTMAEQQGAIAIGDSRERNIVEGHVERPAYLFISSRETSATL